MPPRTCPGCPNAHACQYGQACRKERLRRAATLEDLLPLTPMGARKDDLTDPLHKNPYS